MSDAPVSHAKPVWPLAAAVIGVFAIFLFVLMIARTPATPLARADAVPPEEQWRLTDEGRRARLTEVQGRAATARDSYGWVDREAGVVQLPIDRAIELTIQDINSRR